MKPLRRSPALDQMFVYALVDPGTFEPFYVGRAIDPKERLAKHLRDARVASGVPVKRRTAQLKRAKTPPTMTLLTRTTFADVDRVEALWVQHLRQQFPRLCNVLLTGS